MTQTPVVLKWILVEVGIRSLPPSVFCSKHSPFKSDRYRCLYSFSVTLIPIFKYIQPPPHTHTRTHRHKRPGPAHTRARAHVHPRPEPRRPPPARPPPAGVCASPAGGGDVLWLRRIGFSGFDQLSRANPASR